MVGIKIFKKILESFTAIFVLIRRIRDTVKAYFWKYKYTPGKKAPRENTPEKIAPWKITPRK